MHKDMKRIDVIDVTEPTYDAKQVVDDALSHRLSDSTVELFDLLSKLPQSQAAAELIGLQTPESILNADELAIFYDVASKPIRSDSTGAGKAVVVVKATRLCNLRCTYCNAWAEGPGNVMSFRTQAESIKNLLNIEGVTRYDFVWHGGEVTMLPPSYFKKLIWLQQQFRRPGITIGNSLQTNATMLTEEWLEFLSLAKVGIGISIDGPPEVHDLRRLDRHGKGTSAKVAHGISQLRAHGISFGGLVVVDEKVRAIPAAKLLQYFDEIGFYNIDFLNLVPDNSQAPCTLGKAFVNYDDFIVFLCEIYQEWFAHYRETITVRIFTDLLDVIEQRETTTTNCYWSGNCSTEIFTLESNGVIAPCDKYVGDKDSRHGDVTKVGLGQLLDKSDYHQVGLQEAESAQTRMKQCNWYHLCQGGCPHDRLVNLKNKFKEEDEYLCCGVAPLFNLMEQKYREFGLSRP
ncbi:MAG: SPASM domain-containing protein [Shewanella xiamenensis]|jgi:uncharacterized protein|uniref:radical SAM/SPASM domain-containing protein n=2 Tax=Shewanella TaxID=22 RepID=UPI0021DA9D41|nr:MULTISPECIES: radical SAM protein [unclassified Shewanella]MCD8551934.1 SPASM domain-containing protein [Shewanella xiamenensis]MCD8561357.1 SPASM domain-containing protein [Shewanella xiamenensis]MCU8035691.1 SPASM domain-containing protein [Shewanella sp. SM71]MCU8084199.1 SPASM domain-containing protein [Shewanella sp. SM23]MCU8097569.1 SPASM domain-containing protein [Shewanella sp. SM102]